MKPRFLGRIAAGLVLALALAGCGSDDGGNGSAATGGSGGQITGGSGGSSTGGSSTGGNGGAGTGGASGGTAGSGSGGLDAGTDGPIEYGPYPAGPYGNSVGDTIANLAWEGYVNVSGAAASDTLPYVDYSTDEMRKSGKAYGLIHISAFT